MGLFSIFKKDKKEATNTEVVETVKPSSTINLRKETINKICLEKKELVTQKARVVLAIDYSLSMSSLYKSGKVQELLERIFPVALRFDDDGDMGVWKFDNGYEQLKDMTIKNYSSYVKKYFKGDMGGTNYSPVIRDIHKEYVDRQPLDIPTYVIFITDGDCWDKAETRNLIKKISGDNIFWQFVGIGGSSFGFLEALDDMEDRVLDNADFFAVKDIARQDDEWVYRKLLNEFPSWLRQARNKGIIK